jgi:hypothetical protein
MSETTETTETRTDQLQPGMRVQLPCRGVIRTVDRITESDWLNRNDEPIFYVMYREGRTPEWSDGNSGIASTTWQVVP